MDARLICSWPGLGVHERDFKNLKAGDAKPEWEDEEGQPADTEQVDQKYRRVGRLGNATKNRKVANHTNGEQ